MGRLPPEVSDPQAATFASSEVEFVSQCARALADVRRRAPRVHCITNYAASAFTANILLAVGATPSLSIAEEEIGDFVTTADSLLINLGTLDPQRNRAIALALDAAEERSKPWVLDPVMIDRSSSRLSQARQLLRHRPDVVRGNKAEIKALADCLGETDAAGLAERTGRTVIQTGPFDIVHSDAAAVAIENGHPWMDRVTAMGCVGGATVGAFLALGGTPFSAAWMAVLTLAVAGEIAGSQAQGPGSLQYGLLDALYRLEIDQLAAYSRIRWLNRPTNSKTREST